jgi:VIT1/CCC1 family predicted Fe2+/Mn2+ transporter
MTHRFEPAGPSAGEPGDAREQPIGELMKQLAEETSTLVRQELALAKAELTQKGKQAGLGVGMFGGAGLAGVLVLQTLTALMIITLALVLPAWLSALIVTVLWALVAGALALQGRARLKRATPPVPQQAVETVKEDVEWAKTQIKSDSR